MYDPDMYSETKETIFRQPAILIKINSLLAFAF